MLQRPIVLTNRQCFPGMIGFMPGDHQFTLRQVDQARGDLYAIADEIEALKVQIAGLPSRGYVSRLALMATGTVRALIAGQLANMIQGHQQNRRSAVLVDEPPITAALIVTT
ncbi:MAG: hypothetical protein ACJ8AH_12370 [Stellaceae bacterium]